MQKSTKCIDYLREDEPIPGQLWCCISFVSPEGIKNCKIRAFKIRGVFGTKQEADEKASSLQQKDPDFNVFVGEVGKWLPIDPDPNDVKDQIYYEKELNNLVKGHKDNLEKSKLLEEQRKKEMIRKAAEEEQVKITKESKKKDRLRKKLETKKRDQMQKEGDQILKEIDNEQEELKTQQEKELEQTESELKYKEKLIKTEYERINKSKKELEEKTKNLDLIEDKLSKIKELYNKLKDDKQ